MRSTKTSKLDELDLDELDIPATSSAGKTLSQTNQFSVDVYENAKDFTVVSVVPAVDPENIKIDITEESVSISFSVESPNIKGDLLATEVEWGEFTRSIIFPSELDVEASSAEMKNGVLVVSLPKLVKKSKKTITPKVMN